MLCEFLMSSSSFHDDLAYSMIASVCRAAVDAEPNDHEDEQDDQRLPDTRNTGGRQPYSSKAQTHSMASVSILFNIVLLYTLLLYDTVHLK